VVVRRFGVPVLVRLSSIDPLSRQTVVIQQVAVAGLELACRREVVHRRAEAVTAVPPGHAPEFPQRLLHAVGERLERLRDADAHRFPVRVGQDEVVDHVLERLPRDRDAQRGHVREIGRGEVGGLMNLSEDRELPRSVAGPPLPDPPLERASVGIEELAGVLLAEPVEECLGQELGFGVQLRLDFGPNRSEGIDAGAVGPRRLLAGAGERGVVAVMTGGLVGHPCPPGRVGQRGSFVE